MTAAGLLAGVAGALLVGGLVVFVLGVQRVPPAPVKPGRRRRWRILPNTPRVLKLAALAALGVGFVVSLTTGWWIAIGVMPGAVLGLPALLMTSNAGKKIARLEAMSEWTRSLAGVMRAGQAVEGAIAASLRSTPEAIRPEVSRLVARINSRWTTPDAIRAFAEDLNDATGDLVCAALLVGADKRGKGLAGVLNGLAESVAEDVRARRQVEADRNKPRSVSRQVAGISLVLMGALWTSGLLNTFHSPLGQMILLVLLACYAGCLWWMRRMSIIPEPPRFLGAELRSRAAA